MQVVTVGLIGRWQSLDGLIVYYTMVALQLNCPLKRSTGLIGDVGACYGGTTALMSTEAVHVEVLLKITPERFQVLGVLKCPLKTDRSQVLGGRWFTLIVG
jgi:hypothetical protein